MTQKKETVCPLHSPGCVLMHCRSLYLQTAAAFRYSRCARALSLSTAFERTLRSREREAAAGTVAPQWIHGQLCSMHHYNLGSEGSRAKPKKRDQWWRVSSKHVYSLSIRAHTHAVYFCTVKYTLTPCTRRHGEAPRLGCVGVAMADRDSLPLPLEVRTRLAELELELSEGE